MTLRYALAWPLAQGCILGTKALVWAAGRLDRWGKLELWLPYLGED